jgi:catechol 2,3-dioxygenase
MPTALFVSAGGYHHHVGMNTWHSLGATPAPADMVGLRFFTITLPTDEALRAVVARLDAAGIPHTETDGIIAVRDPWGNIALLQVGAVPDARAAAKLADIAASFPSPVEA